MPFFKDNVSDVRFVTSERNRGTWSMIAAV
jgi:hypothetical protein